MLKIHFPFRQSTVKFVIIAYTDQEEFGLLYLDKS